ncbi:hypothetical protein DFH07DRAFT_826258 [Mycena maculata]|uniref:DUF6699 domain-containing protein n=1 Tax=Mycena maculata TaxID=230809 RepID=A0AAD7N9Y6_9AGAR|nr:hypothetical protein DFH07DRAFT_826258 [Mycena maculata]
MSICGPLLSITTTRNSYPMHVAPQRHPDTHTDPSTTVRLGENERGMFGACNLRHERLVGACATGPCVAGSQISRTCVQAWTAAPPTPGLRWGRSPYTCIPLPNTESATRLPERRPSARVPRPAGIPAAQPPRPNRITPVALPSQIQGVTSIVLHPTLTKPMARLALDFAAIPTAESNAAWGPLLSQPATHPELPSLTIISPRLPWAITAHASGRTLRCLTVADVLGAIHQALRLQVDEDQFVDMTQGGGHCSRRGINGNGNGGITYRGMTRMDLLEGRTRFAGLFASDMGCDIWILQVM